MKIVLAGAFGNLGADILSSLINAGYDVVAADTTEKDIDKISKSDYQFKKIDVTNKETLTGICDGADIVVSTVGLTKGSATVSNYDIDYKGNLNLLREAEKAGVKKFVYISVIKADSAEDVPMVHSKYLMEEKLKQSSLEYIIYRPTGYFYDIVKVFKPMIESGKVSLLGKEPVYANVIDTPDFANFITEHLDDTNKTYSIGGKETLSYEEIANLCFKAAGKAPNIKYAPAWLFDILAKLPKNKKNGKWALIKFSKWTLTNNMVGDTVVDGKSFSEYIKKSFEKEVK